MYRVARNHCIDRLRAGGKNTGLDDRQLLFLRFYESLRVREIAGIVGQPEGTVKYRLHEL